MISATLDSSVYVRALHFGGLAALIIAHVRAGSIRIDISDPILNETLAVRGSSFSTDLDCKRCVYYAFGKLNRAHKAHYSLAILCFAGVYFRKV